MIINLFHNSLLSSSSKMVTLFLLTLLSLNKLSSVLGGPTSSSSSSTCEYGTRAGNKLYKYSLTSYVNDDLAHGVLSEDGFYKVAANDTIIWFQLCGGLIFNHDPPRCVDCWDCGGPSRCGMGCSALVAKYTGGYYACTAIGHEMNFDINLTDGKAPDKGVTITMRSNNDGVNCSLSVSVVCDSKGLKEPKSFEQLGTCHYATELRHPSGCAKIAAHGTGWGWFGFIFTVLLCSLAAYLLIGGAYRYFSLGIRGFDIIPNLDFWISIPHRVKSAFTSLVQRVRGPTYHHRSSYSSVNF